MDNLLKDIRYSIRTMIKRPGFTLVVVLALALGIGANTAIFSVVNTVLLKPFVYKDSDRLAVVWGTSPQKEVGIMPVTPADYTAWNERNTVFEQVAYSRDAQYSLTGAGEPESVRGYRFSANFFDVLGVQPLHGRTFTAEEDRPGANRVVVLSYKLWQRRFGGDTGVIGQSVTLSGNPYTIIGVMPPGFEHPHGTELWTPVAIAPADFSNHTATILRIMARLKPGVTIEQAQTEMSTIAAAVAEQYPDTHTGRGAKVVTLRDVYTGDVKAALLVLLAAVGFVLLIACANVANLLLARAASRQKEVAVRSALGASRARLIRQFLTESLMLSLAGGAAGILLAIWSTGILVSLFPTNIENLSIPIVEQIPIDAKVIGFALLISIVTGMVFGLAPALQASKSDLNETLKEGGRGSMSGRRGRRLRDLLVISEMAIAVVLLVGAGLLIKSFARLQKSDLGMNIDNVLTAQVQLPQYKYPDLEKRRIFVGEVTRRVRSLPGVEAAGATNFLPLTGFWGTTFFNIEGRPAFAPGEEPEVDNRLATEDYFKAMGMRMLRGRAFTATDREGSPQVAIINQKFADSFFQGEDPVGKRLNLGDANEPSMWEIVGVVGDVKSFGLSEDTHLEIFRPFDQVTFPLIAFAIRTTKDPTSIVAAVRNEVWSVDKDLPFLGKIIPLERLASDSVTLRRVSMLLVGAFAALALILAALGIYGVMSYSVTQRTHEIGVRMALGAKPADVLRLVVRHGLALTLAGVGVGVGGALLLTRFMTSMLYGVSATDPLTFAVITVILIGVALGACAVPARRATKVDPMIALRYE
jgi:putative ABC transport system permease protein